jgi:hypothetical protein
MDQSKLKPEFFSEVLQGNAAAVAIRAEGMIKARSPGCAVVACQPLPVEHYQRLVEDCEISSDSIPQPSGYRYWGGEDIDQLYWNFEQVVWQVDW